MGKCNVSQDWLMMYGYFSSASLSSVLVIVRLMYKFHTGQYAVNYCYLSSPCFRIIYSSSRSWKYFPSLLICNKPLYIHDPRKKLTTITNCPVFALCHVPIFISGTFANERFLQSLRNGKHLGQNPRFFWNWIKKLVTQRHDALIVFIKIDKVEEKN